MWWCRLVPVKNVRIGTYPSVRDEYTKYTKANCLVCKTVTELVPPSGTNTQQ